MLSRSGLSIRKLIPNRRLSDEDLGGAELKKEDSLLALWTDQDGGNNLSSAYRRSSRKKRAPAPIIATSPLTHLDILRPLPPLPSETPRSSASSSCRCDRHARCDCPLLNLKRRSPLYSISSKEASEDPALLSCVNSSDPDDTLAHHIPRSRFNSFGDAKSKEEVAQTSSPKAQDKEEALKDQKSDGSLSAELSNDVRQFMQEAEDAFKVIGTEVHVNQPTVFQTTKASSADVPHNIEPPPPTPPPKETPVLPLSKSPPAKAPSMFSSFPKSPPKDNSPSQTPKRKKSKKSKRTGSMRPIRKPTALKQAVKSGPRWTLTENVSELFMGRLFHSRIEADEMLTPDQIEAFKQQRITKLQVDKMAEALEHQLAGIAIDEFPSRVGSAGVKTDMEILTEEQPVKKQHRNNTPPLPPRHRPALHKSNISPTTSSRHVRSSSRRIMTELPIIPETSITPRTSGDLYFSNESDDSLGNTSTSEYVYLQSPRFSLIAPTFQHGPIRLSKCDLLPDMRLGHDESLDWTAFQMAISGGAGDLFSDSDDTLRRREEDEIADITEWWDSWHFESTGKLVTSNYEASSPTSTLSGDEIPDLSYSEIESDNPNSPRLRWQHAQRNTGASGLKLDLGFAKEKKCTSPHYFADDRSNANDTWRQASEQKQDMVNRQSVNSLPPSPMLDLRVIRSASGDDLDVVPMGYNLGHDLGDFLKWEAEHAFAGDFNSPSGLM
ncbi:hypothetical protein F4824DRAFT_499522 [Ustulina deusta]|nr:hypothetical protein F4823DRAFT_559622 [Ustulina deusta]KAI3338191.1 hypothetical protein F4824DRAFT_499522 [Ustulina deusta]